MSFGIRKTSLPWLLAAALTGAAQAATTLPALNLNTYKVTGTGPVTFVEAPYGSTGPGSESDPYTPFSDYQAKTGQDTQSTCTSASSATC